MASGIYQITNRVNGKRYIGSAVRVENRWWNHLSSLRHNTHHNPHLQAAFRKYGEEAFALSVLEYIEDLEQLIVREQHFLDMLNPEYNILSIAGSSLGCKRSLETCRKLKKIATGRRLSEETCRKISQRLTGRQFSDEHRQNLSKALTGKRLSEETKQKMSEARRGKRNHNYGKPLSAKTRAGHKAYFRKLRASKKQAQSAPKLEFVLQEGAGG